MPVACSLPCDSSSNKDWPPDAQWPVTVEDSHTSRYQRRVEVIFSNPGALGTPAQQDIAYAAVFRYYLEVLQALQAGQPWPSHFSGDPSEWGLQLSIEPSSIPPPDEGAYDDAITVVSNILESYPLRSLEGQVSYTRRSPPLRDPEFLPMGKLKLAIDAPPPPAPHNWPQFSYETPIQGAEAVQGLLKFDLYSPFTPRIIDPVRDFWMEDTLTGLLNYINTLPQDEQFHDTAEIESQHARIRLKIDVNDPKCTVGIMAKVVRTMIALVKDMGAIQTDVAIHEGAYTLHGLITIRWGPPRLSSGRISTAQ